MAVQILVVEDDKDIRRNMQKILESEGYVVQAAENGQLALDYLNSATDLPAVILLDLMMPVMDGFQFREAQEKIPRIEKIPVVILTADGHIDEKRMRVGAREALKKPASIDSILDAIERAVGSAT